MEDPQGSCDGAGDRATGKVVPASSLGSTKQVNLPEGPFSISWTATDAGARVAECVSLLMRRREAPIAPA